MNILLIILLIIIAIVLLLAIIASFSSNNYIIEKEILINKPKQVVYDYIKFLKNSEKYNKWVMADPNMKKDYIGTDGTVGFIYAWDSTDKGVGKGEQEIKNLVEGSVVDYEIRFIKPFTNISTATLELASATPDQTKVKWRFAGKRNLMLKIMHMVFNLQKVLGNDLNTSLTNLKRIFEQ